MRNVYAYATNVHVPYNDIDIVINLFFLIIQWTVDIFYDTITANCIISSSPTVIDVDVRLDV